MSQSDKMKKCGALSLFLLCLLFLTTMIADAKAQELRRPAAEFSRHRVVLPTAHHGRTKREISSTRDTDGSHHPDVTIKMVIDGEDYTLDLRLNEELVPNNHIVRYQKEGKAVQHNPKTEELDICQYSGTVRDKPGSWVALSTCRGVRGVIYDGKQMKYIHPADGDDIQSKHYIYDHSDLNTSFHCGYKGGVTNDTQYDPLLLKEHLKKKEIERSRASRHKRRAYDDTLVRGPYNANKLSRYVELVLIADHGEYRANNEDLNLVHHQLKDVANIINSVYSPLNIFIALVGVVVWTERDEIQLEEDGDKTLNNFLHYRKELSLTIPNDNAQLLTRQRFNEGVVGKGLKGPICTYEFSGAVSTNHSEVIGLVAATIAHEMGHNFGMEHDTEEDCECVDEKCIMSPSSTSVVPVHWSSCSLKSLALAFEKGMDYCLRNKPKKLFDSPTCGNGFVEAGEQCDCGRSVDKGNAAWAACVACCRSDVCLLRDNATCATGACCDLATCRPMSAGSLCRAAARECDLPEYCSGRSEFCPDDYFVMDSTPCANGQAFCAHGSCRSHTDQCRLLWGTTGQDSSPKCYSQNNIRGTINGNCGYDRVHKLYRACAGADVRCGTLQCRHLNERLEFGMESVASLSQMFINNNGSIIPCRTAIIDLGLNDVDPGLVPDGAKCGENMMCMKQKCMTVEAVQALVSMKDSSVCPSNCSGHGVCNSEGHCHCEVGYAPPLCALPGTGGSVDSGPATDPTVQRNFMVTMYVIFLGIVPSILVALFLFYYSKQNVIFWWQKPKKKLSSPKKASLPSRISKSASKFASNFQNNSQNPQPVVHTLSTPDDMSSSLLRSDSERSPAGNINPSVNFFGNFKGFSLTPVEKSGTAQNEVKPEIVSINTNAKIISIHRGGSSNHLVNQNNVKSGLRSAPPLPMVPNVAKTSPQTSPSVKRTNSTVQNKIKSLISADKTDDSTPVIANPTPRPVISSPILEASTCTRKELISPLQGSKTLGPIRTAPTVPNSNPELPVRPLSMHATGNIPNKPLPEEPKKVREGISLNRIASFLKQDKPKEKERKPVERSHSMPKNSNHQIKVPKATDKVALRNLQISNPILQKNIDLPVNTVPVVSDNEDAEDPKAFVNRAQSMRAPIGQKITSIQSFGSMRKAPVRPLSVVERPTAPPPPLPNNNIQEMHKETPVYQNPKPKTEITQTDYVDCIEEKPMPLAHIDESCGENIYTIIEESPVKHSNPITAPAIVSSDYNTPKPIKLNSGSTESVGLLGEIVNEIQNRNFESIYSASTLSRKKKDKEKNENRDSTYMNADYKTPESVYSNSGAKSNVSTTSSGYLLPSAVNVPTFTNKRDSVEVKHDEEPPSSPSLKGVSSKIPTFSRQVTPPGLRTTSTFKSVPQSPKVPNKNSNVVKSISNSPDVVSSCSETKNTKPPDVINNNKPLDSRVTKPSVAAKPIDNRPPLRTAPTVDKRPIVKSANPPAPSLKPVNSSSNVNKNDKNSIVNRTSSKVEANVKAIADNLNKNKPKFPPKPTAVVSRTDSNVKPSATKLTAKPSNVASLQQKFENRKSFGKETAAVTNLKK